MNILIACLHHATCTGRKLYDAFIRLGHDTRHIGWQGQHQRGLPLWQSQGDFEHTWPDWTPDLLIYAETAYKPWHHEGYKHVPHVAVVSCNDVANMRRDPALDRDSLYVRFFLAHRDSAGWPVTQEDEEWLPCAQDPALCPPSSIPWQERAFDITLIGSLGKMRNEWLDRLTYRGFKVGRGSFFGPAYTNAYHESRISLCVNTHRSPAMRYFETAAMGCLVMGDFVPELHALNPVAKGMVFVENVEEAIDRCHYFLSHPGAAKAMIQLSMEWARYHTYEARAQQIIDWYTKEYTA